MVDEMQRLASSQDVIIRAPERRLNILKQASVKTEDVWLSVIIPNYNTAEFVVPAVESVLHQTFVNLEVIVVDDGSNDDSIERIQSISDERLTCVTQENRGLAGARNSGIMLARGACLGFLDSDDLWFAEKAEIHMALLAADPQIGMTYSHSEYLLENGSSSGQFLTSNVESPSAMDLLYRNHIGNGSTPIIRKVCFDNVGHFDESLKYCEDIEMWIRISAYSGYQLRLVPKALTGYRLRKGSMSSTVQRMVPDAEIAVQRFRKLLPNISGYTANRAFAQIVRVASRKAFTSGDREASRVLLLKAWRRSPALPLYDIKALALLIMHVLSAVCPPWLAESLFTFIHLTRKVQFRAAGLGGSRKI
jgi:hypothetical protein